MTEIERTEEQGEPNAGIVPSDETYLAASDPRDLLRRRTFALWGTGAFTGVTALLALTSLALRGDSGSAVLALYWTLVLLRLIAIVIGWIALARWMSGVRAAFVAAGAPAPAAWQVWASWFIPVYGLWGPFSAMRQLTSHLPAIEATRHRWWVGFIFSWVFVVQASFQESLGWNLALVLLSAAVLVFSFVMLRTVIDRTTKSLLRH
ncbi:hypothetical protein [Demequina zhanjiangensis]|uniref:DUF4328 domain-containing protein n=1 Tax=Demequina zhanjiangensis TaxID=3051659 RepID=A0ABT8G4K1_9MICO|nr:hypothetical protein [Demequina sp. SYSU T00b26]MDN4474056.1 hypothetical protein [Demequina sp. SYSU T00b26]